MINLFPSRLFNVIKDEETNIISYILSLHNKWFIKKFLNLYRKHKPEKCIDILCELSTEHKPIDLKYHEIIINYLKQKHTINKIFTDEEKRTEILQQDPSLRKAQLISQSKILFNKLSDFYKTEEEKKASNEKHLFKELK